MIWEDVRGSSQKGYSGKMKISLNRRLWSKIKILQGELLIFSFKVRKLTSPFIMHPKHALSDSY